MASLNKLQGFNMSVFFNGFGRVSILIKRKNYKTIKGIIFHILPKYYTSEVPVWGFKDCGMFKSFGLGSFMWVQWE